MRNSVTIAAGAALFSVGAYSAPMFGPEGRFSTSFSRLEYDPTAGCSKPFRPYSKDEYAVQRYRDDAVRYVDCLKSAATKDTSYAAEVIADGYEEAVDEFVAEVKRGY